MTMRAVVIAALCAGVVAGCGAQSSDRGPTADLSKIADIKASFGPQFHITEIAPSGIDPKVLAGQKLPDGIVFQPASCGTFATGQLVPAGTEGNMSSTRSASSWRWEPVPVVEPGPDCQKVSFAGGPLHGTVEAVEVPRIDGTKTIGVHRVVQTVIDGKPRTGEVFNYSAHFGNYQVIVSANPLVLPDKPVVPVNTQRARDLLIAGVNAIRK